MWLSMSLCNRRTRWCNSARASLTYSPSPSAGSPCPLVRSSTTLIASSGPCSARISVLLLPIRATGETGLVWVGGRSRTRAYERPCRPRPAPGQRAPVSGRFRCVGCVAADAASVAASSTTAHRPVPDGEEGTGICCVSTAAGTTDPARRIQHLTAIQLPPASWALTAPPRRPGRRRVRRRSGCSGRHDSNPAP